MIERNVPEHSPHPEKHIVGKSVDEHVPFSLRLKGAVQVFYESVRYPKKESTIVYDVKDNKLNVTRK